MPKTPFTGHAVMQTGAPNGPHGNETQTKKQEIEQAGRATS